MQSPELRRLLGKYIDNSISEEEFLELWKSLGDSSFDADWHEVIVQVLDDKRLHGMSDPEQAALRLARIRVLMEGEAQDEPVVRLPARRQVWYAAAAILLIISGIYLITRSTYNREPMVAAKPATPEKIKPGVQRAMLTLADGTTIMLDSLANGKIAQQGATQVLKLANGQIRYQAAGAKDASRNVAYNTMATPKGGQYQLTLPDGSNVWLNAASSITYPTAFAADVRHVKITGEVYFEVARDKRKPFHVTAGDQEIEVLGTLFNINAYEDEGRVKTSLLEGSVKVNKVMLQPGQAYMQGKAGATDVDQDIAWKHGVFNFNNQTLVQVMRQLARWYDLEVVYPQGIPKKEYGGEMGRNLTLDQVLKGLENSGVHFQLEGRRLMVKS